MFGFRPGLTLKIGLISGVLLLALGGTVLLLALRQQQSLIMDFSLQEIQGKLDPVERKTEEIRFYGSALEELQDIRSFYIDKEKIEDNTKNWNHFDLEKYNTLQSRLRTALGSRGTELGEAGFNQLGYYASYTHAARQKMRNSDPSEIKKLLENYTQVGRALDWRVLGQTDYRQTLRSAFEGLDSRYRIQTVGLFFQAYFDTSLLSPARDIDFDVQRLQSQLNDPDLEAEQRSAIYENLRGLLQRRNRLNRLGNPEINLLQPGTNEEIRASLNDVRQAYYERNPTTEIHHSSYSTEQNNYLISTRTLYMKPEISERARLVLSSADSLDAQIWKRYLAEESRVHQKLRGVIEQLRAIRKDIGSEPYALLRSQDYKALYAEYERIRKEKEHALEQAIEAARSLDKEALEDLEQRKEDTREAIQQSRKRIEELGRELKSAKEGTNDSAQSPESDQSQTEIPPAAKEQRIVDLEQQISDEQSTIQILEKRIPSIDVQISEFYPRSRRIADAFQYLPDAMLLDRAVLDFVYDPTAYFSYEGSKLNRQSTQSKWSAMRLWIRTACSEVASCGNVYLPYLAGNGQWIRPRRILEDFMWEYDTSSSPALARRALFENTAAFTRIFANRSAIDQTLQEEEHRLLDMTLSIGLRLVLVALLISLFFVRRIKSIIESVELVGSGNLDTRFHYPGRDELGILASTLNKMTADLRHRESMIQELSAAEQIQSQLIPRGLPEKFTDSLSFGYMYRASSGVGGDYFDFIEASNSRLIFCIADVTGHGPGPAMIMAMMRSHLRSLVQMGMSEPGRILRDLNTRVYAETPSHVFITMLLGVYDRETNRLEYSSAGHNRGLVYRYEKDTVEVLQGGGLPLGLEEDDVFSSILEEHKTDLNKGDLFFQYTDGINEATNNDGDQFGTRRIERILQAAGKKKPETIMSSMVTNLETFTEKKVMKDGPTELSDDIAMIAFRRVR
ncbi:MAG: hypothetical protein CMN77_13705 [Spirochaetaceae bacterium]|nr:hypothetical protein [Spirochaetaceae bacterium]|tara:strand:- start:25343 stop:28228 length:2886 start_codon:yes stop_codon:yes gene_type:complete